MEKAEMMKTIYLYNPTSKDFSIPYDINGDGNPVTFTLHAQEIEPFDEPVANHIKGALGHQVAQGLRGKGTYEDAMKKALVLIEVDMGGTEGTEENELS